MPGQMNIIFKLKMLIANSSDLLDHAWSALRMVFCWQGITDVNIAIDQSQVHSNGNAQLHHGLMPNKRTLRHMLQSTAFQSDCAEYLKEAR